LIKDISVLIPALNEEDNLPSLIKDINSAFESLEVNYEIIIIDDFSQVPVSSYLSHKNVKIFRNPFTKGQSFSILKAAQESKYDYLVTIDGDGQNPPYEIIKLLDTFNKNYDNCDVVSGIRKSRKDGLLRTFYSKFANFIIRVITKTKCKDLGCSLKIFRKVMLEDIKFNGDIHRILVPLFEYRGYKLFQQEVDHLPRKFGKTKYGFSRITAVIIDSILLYFTNGFTSTARYSLGRLSFMFGFFSVTLFLVSLYQKEISGVFVHRNPIFLIGITLLFISLQLLVTSLISFFIENK
tara:strand:+ start:2588 stop:3472 length:885 start_codon:yes stop_codon:yes gene_type:complete